MNVEVKIHNPNYCIGANEEYISFDKFIHGMMCHKYEIVKFEQEGGKTSITLERTNRLYLRKYKVTTVKMDIGAEENHKEIYVVHKYKFDWSKWSKYLIFDDECLAKKVCDKLNDELNRRRIHD